MPWIRASFIHYEEDAAADSGTNWKLMIGGEKEAEQQFGRRDVSGVIKSMSVIRILKQIKNELLFVLATIYSLWLLCYIFRNVKYVRACCLQSKILGQR